MYAISETSNIGVGWPIRDVESRTLSEERAEEWEWALRTASRVRNFIPERVHVPRHRADVPVVVGG